MEGDQVQPSQPTPTQPSQSAPTVHAWGSRKISPVFLFTLIAVIAIVLILIFVLKWHSTNAVMSETEKINLTYSIALEDGTLLDSGTATFNSGAVASSLGFKTNKLDAELALMRDGEEKNITLEAENAYGAYDDKLVFNYNRTVIEVPRKQELNKTFVMSVDMFKTNFDEQPVVNKTYQNNMLRFRVISFNDTTVELAYEMKVGDRYPSGLFDYDFEVIEVDDKIVLKLQGEDEIYPIPSSIGQGNLEVNFTDDSVKITLTPVVDSWIALEGMPKAKVTKMNSTHLFLDANNELAGKKIVVTVKVNSRYKEKSTVTGAVVIEGAPTMQVFIMSHCPYGVQIVKGMLPVMKKFKGKANIELRFVSYTMHGAQEELDNKRIACIREEQNDKLIDYLECFVSSSGSEDSIQACIAKVDKTKLESCVALKAETYLETDKALNEKYGVRGSPTIILDGKEVLISRDPQSIANALCNAFAGSKPSVCSEAFSTTVPSPGFGTTASSSGSGGSCGV